MKRLLSIVLALSIMAGALYGAPKKLTLSIWGNDARKTLFEDLVKDFTKTTGNEVEIVLIPFGEYMQKLSVQMAASSAPDLVWLSEKMVPQFIASGQLINIAPALKSDAAYDYKDFFPSAMEGAAKGSDTLYGVPFSFGPRIIFYNKTLFKQKGLKTPAELAKEGKWTLDAFYQAGKALTDKSKGIYGIKLFNATAPKDWSNALSDIVWAYGAEFFSEDMKTFKLNSPEGIKAIQYFADMLFKDEIHPKPGDQTQFESGKIAMAHDTFSTSVSLRAVKDLEWDIAPNPTGPNKTARVASGFAYYSILKGPNQAEAAQLLKYLTSKEMMLKLVSSFQPPRRYVLAQPAFVNQPDGKPSAEAIKASFFDPIEKPGVRSLPAHVNYQQIDVEMQILFDLLYAKSVTVPELLKMMEAKIQPLLDAQP
jgi:multiple sugar transport system substrate-binding protein